MHYTTNTYTWPRALGDIVRSTMKEGVHMGTAPLETQIDRLSKMFGRFLDHLVDVGDLEVEKASEIIGVFGLDITEDDADGW